MSQVESDFALGSFHPALYTSVYPLLWGLRLGPCAQGGEGRQALELGFHAYHGDLPCGHC